MNQRNESIKKTLGDVDRLLADANVQTYIFIITNLIFFPKLSIPSLLSKYFETPIKITVTDGIAFLTVFVLAAGVLYYMGVYGKRHKEYRFTNSPFKFLERSAIMGSILIATIMIAFVISEYIKLSIKINYSHAILILIIFFSVSSLLSSKREDISFLKLEYHLAIYITIFMAIYLITYPFPEQQNLDNVIYIITISSLIILFGYKTEKHRPKINNLTLKMINSNEPIENLELFSSTDIDYCFKDSEGNEFIVPIGQIEKITYKKT